MAKISDELQKVAYEPLLPAEKKLIAWSLILGTLFMGLLIWISYRFFPGL